METAGIIKSFLPDLVTAISGCVQPVSDQCLAKGLIPESVYKRVLESGRTSEDKARTLILAVKASTETDSRCLEILLGILEEQLPFQIREKLLSEIRKELKEKVNTCRAVVPSSQTVQIRKVHGSGNMCQDVVSVSPNKSSTELSNQVIQQQFPLLNNLLESVKQQAEACVEKRMLEEQLKSKLEEIEKLKGDQKSKTQEKQDLVSVANQRILACEAEIAKMKGRIEAIESTIEDRAMRTKRGQTVMVIKMKEFLQEIQDEKEMLVNDLQRKNDEVLKADKKWAEEFETKLKEKDEELQALQTKYEKATDELKMKDLEHTVALQGKDLEIKNLELQQERSKAVQRSASPSPSYNQDYDYDDDDSRPFGDDYYTDDEYEYR